MIAAAVCQHCNREWFAERVRGPAPLYCEPCRPVAYREASKTYNRTYRATNREQLRVSRRASYASNPTAARNSQLKIKYGITLEQYSDILAQQGDGCAFCGVTTCARGRSFNVDHDHACCSGTTSCGRCLRGLLCNYCNSQLVVGYEKLPPELRTWGAMNKYLESRIQIERDPWLTEGGS